MRELILNQASLGAPDLGSAIDWLKDVTIGIAALVHQGVSEHALRSALPLQEAKCLPGFSLSDVIFELRDGGYRDEFLFLMRLTTKVPLLFQLSSGVKDRFLSCDNWTLPPSAGSPLVLCAITRGIAVGFPSHDPWDRDQLNVRFEELLPNGEFEEALETIDNLTRSNHAIPINDRHRSLLLRNFMKLQDSKAIWDARKDLFPHLVFGLDAEKQVGELNPGLLNTVCHRLVDLDQTAFDWLSDGTSAPPWRVMVTDESDSVKSNANLREARRFRSYDGSPQLFFWHARFGSNGRIHLRFDRQKFEIQIGYIGSHLPL